MCSHGFLHHLSHLAVLLLGHGLLGHSLLHFLFLWLIHGLLVGCDDADEVSEEGITAAGDVKGNNNLLLSGGLNESDTIITSCNCVFLVEEHEIDSGPGGDKGNTDDYEHAGNEKALSTSMFILSEEKNGKG